MNLKAANAKPEAHRGARYAAGWRQLLLGVGVLLLTISAFHAALLDAAPAAWSNPVYLATAVAVAVTESMARAGVLRHWVTRGGVVYRMAMACAVLLLLCGAGFWSLQPPTPTPTPTLADSLWLAFTRAPNSGRPAAASAQPASRDCSDAGRDAATPPA